MKIRYLLLFAICFSVIAAHSQCPTCKEEQHGVNDKSYHKPENGNATIGQSYVQENVCGLNYVQASAKTTTRYNTPVGTGFPATLAISGLPNSHKVLKAFLYYEASYTEATAPVTSAVITNPLSVTDTISSAIIGTDVAKCWGETGTASYRVDVTANISSNGNYKINLRGFSNAASEVDGITLLIIYKDTVAAYAGSIAICDGCYVSLGGPLNYTATGFNALAASSKATAFGIAADMQSNVNGGVNSNTYNGSNGTFPNNFWNFDTIATNLSNGQSSCGFNQYTNNGGECWAWVAAGLYWQYSNCTVGFNEIKSSAGKVMLYPNPNNGSFNLSIRNYELEIKNSVIEIYNTLGEKIYSAPLNFEHSTFGITLSNEPLGLYLYRVTGGDGTLVGQGKFLIER